MSGNETNGCSCSYWSSCVLYFVWLIEEVLDISQSWLSINPSSSILRLLLGPADFSVFELFKLSNDFLKWEWAIALNSQNSDIINIILSSSCFKIIINLSRAEHDLSNLLRSNESWIHIVKKKVESGTLGEFLDIRACTLQPEELLRGNNDEWLSKWHSHLSSQDVEVVGSSGTIDDLNVCLLQDVFVVVVHSIEWNELILVTKLQVSLSSS